MSKSQSNIGKVFEWKLIKRMVAYARPYRGLFSLAFVLILLKTLLAPLVPIMIQRILDGPVVTGDTELLQSMVMIILGILSTQAFVLFGMTYLTTWLGQSVIRDIRKQVFNHITSLRLKFFDNTPIGTLQTRTISDVETLHDIFSQGIIGILGELLQVFAILAVMLWFNWKLTLVVLVTLPILLTATYIFKNKIKVAFQNVRKYVSLMNAFLQEHITGILVTQIFNRELEEEERFKELNKEHRNAHLKSVLYYSIFFPVVEIISALGVALLVWYGTGQVLHTDFQFGELTMFLMFLNMFFRPIRMLADRFNTLQLGMVSAERIFSILDTQEIIPNTGEQRQLPESSNGQLGLEFQRVHFAYNEPDWVLKDVSFSVKAGEKVAIVGSTGAGKTTIINLLTRFYELNRGKILINGTDIESLELNSLRTMIGMVLQDVFLFSGSIYNNITLENPAIPEEAVYKAAKAVGADSFIQRLPGKYDFNVQERGATLSAGQRQLIAFARVLVYDPQILILDEATSNVDTESEELIQHAIDTVMAGRTSIIIAHRLSTIQKADNILVMDKGKVVESGNHQELLKQEGIYRRLYQLQFAGV